jgi:hypothetical protein
VEVKDFKRDIIAKKLIKLGCFEIVPVEQKLTRKPNFFDNMQDAFSACQEHKNDRKSFNTWRQS